MKCLRCGRQISEGALFCDVCVRTTGVPLEESPYLSARPLLPVRNAAQVKPSQPKPAANEEKKGKKPRGLIAAVVVLSLVCAALLAACGYGVKLYLDGARDRSRLAAQREENARLSARIEEAQGELAAEQAENQALRETIRKQEQEIIRLEQIVNTERMQGAETDQTLRELREDNLRLIDENDAYAKQLIDMETETQRLTDRVGVLEREVGALRQKTDFVDSHIVFIENDGTGYYHSYDCAHFKKNSYWAYSKNLAISQGYEPCPDCQ